MTASPPPAARLSRALRAAALMIAAATLLAACSSSGTAGSGGGSSSSAPGSSASGASTSASSPAAAPTTATSSAVALGGGGSFCDLARAEKANAAKEEAAYAGSSPAQLEKLEETALAQLPVFAAQAPSAIRPAVNTLVAADEKLFKVLKAAKFDFRKINLKEVTSFESPAFVKATTTIDGYLTNVCHISSTVPSTLPSS